MSKKNPTVASSASFYQAVPPAPGRPSAPGQTNSQIAQPTGHGDAPHAPPPAPGGGFMGLLPILVLVPMVFLLMWSSRSQQKKQAAALASLQKGDRVVLQSGLIGRLVEMGERVVKVEIASGVKVEVLRTSITGKDGGDGTVTAGKQ